jgi:hypothetical protein
MASNPAAKIRENHFTQKSSPGLAGINGTEDSQTGVLRKQAGSPGKGSGILGGSGCRIMPNESQFDVSVMVKEYHTSRLCQTKNRL